MKRLILCLKAFLQEDPSWIDTYGDAILSILRDFANPALEHGDPNFTFMRNKDWFVGHSWAAG